MLIFILHQSGRRDFLSNRVHCSFGLGIRGHLLVDPLACGYHGGVVLSVKKSRNRHIGVLRHLPAQIHGDHAGIDVLLVPL